MMGRREKAKRLANPVSKMVDELMADFPELFLDRSTRL